MTKHQEKIEELAFPVDCDNNAHKHVKQALEEAINYGIAVGREWLVKELLPVAQEDVDFGAKHQQMVSTKVRAKLLEIIALSPNEEK